MSTSLSAAKGQSKTLLSLDDDLFTAHFDRHPFKISHHLVNHPLLQLPRLVQLAQSIGSPILYFHANQRINQVDDESHGAQRTFVGRKLDRPNLSPADTLAQIENCNAWLQLRDIGKDPEYAKLLHQIIDEFRAPSEQVSPGLSAPRADIFVSSPGATTPFHLDEEHNFLLQIRGSKRLSIADGFNPAVLDRASLRAYFQGSGELAKYSEQLEHNSVHIELSPGEGVHIPPCFPHWVQNGAEVSVSLGILWYSDVTARRRHLYLLNKYLERIGFSPAPPGSRPTSDAIKTLPLMMKRRLRRWMQR
jgi:hypothetical protein